MPKPNKLKVTCTNNNCKRKMHLRSCKRQMNVELTLTDDVSNKQYKVTAFSNALNKIENFSGRDEDYFENVTLDL